MDVFLAFWLLSVSEANVLPLAWPEQSVARVCLCQQPRFYLIVGVYTNSEGTAHHNTLLWSINYEYLRNNSSFLINAFETSATLELT